MAPFHLAGQQQAGAARPLPPPAGHKVQAGGAAVFGQRPAGEAAAQQPARAPRAARSPAAKAGAPPAKRAKRGEQGAAGMQYFLQLQHGSGGAASSSSSGDHGSLEAAVEQHQRQASVSVHTAELPARHAQLLRLLREDEDRLVRTAPAPGVPPELARSPFTSLAVLQRVLEETAGAWLAAADFGGCTCFWRGSC